MQQNILSEHIYTIGNFWSPEECVAYIQQSETAGYSPATINTDFGARVVTGVRNNNRVLHTDVQLAEALWQKLQVFPPPAIGNSVPIGLNELFRFYRYEPGQQFKRHRDQSYMRNEREASYYTFMIYLNDDFVGGDTRFNHLSVKPKQGTALVFLHAIEHEGSEVTEGLKYVLRTDVMYRLTTES